MCSSLCCFAFLHLTLFYYLRHHNCRFTSLHRLLQYGMDLIPLSKAEYCPVRILKTLFTNRLLLLLLLPVVLPATVMGK